MIKLLFQTVFVIFVVGVLLMINLLFQNVFVIFVVGVLLARVSYPLIQYMFKKISSRLPSPLNQNMLTLSKTPYALLVLCSFWYLSSQMSSIDNTWLPLLSQSTKFILGYALIIIFYQALDIFEIYLKRLMKDTHKDHLHKHLLPYSKKIIKVASALIITLLILQNAGLNVSSLVASLGIGGIAIALGAKETLGHLFGGLTIIIDKPFSVGDWIHCGDMEGTVEDIGFRSTKIKTFYDSLVTLPNSLIASSIIDNLGRRQSRRTRITLDLTYDTSPEEIEAFVEGIKHILKANTYVRKDYFQVYFSGYSSSSLQIFLNFFLKVSDWDTELLQKQNIFLEILRLSKELNLSFAFPTQTLDIPSLPAAKDKPLKPSLDTNTLKTKATAFGLHGTLSQPEGLGIYKPDKPTK